MSEFALVIKDDEQLPGTIAVGWRVRCKNGEYADVMWGNTENHESLQRLVFDPDFRKHEPPIAVADERVETKGDEPLVVPDWWAKGEVGSE